VACMGEKRNTKRDFVGKPRADRTLGIPSINGKIIFKLFLTVSQEFSFRLV